MGLANSTKSNSSTTSSFWARNLWNKANWQNWTAKILNFFKFYLSYDFKSLPQNILTVTSVSPLTFIADYTN